MRTRRFALLLALALTAISCGDDSASPQAGAQPKETGESRTEEGRTGSLEAPPPVTVTGGERELVLEPWTFCYRSGCADGIPPDPLPDLGSPDEVIVQFPLETWTFSASFTPAGERCGRVQTVKTESIGGGRFVLKPAGFADTYDVTLFGRGDGDLFVSFRWTTTTDGPLPEPKARLAVLADHDGEVDSYGVELELRNLARTPRRARAEITVTASNGESLRFVAEPARGGCFPEGTLYWDGPDDDGLAAADLGEPPFIYDLEIDLNGTRYVARATWPQDEIRGNEPSVALEFSPPLPGLD